MVGVRLGQGSYWADDVSCMAIRMRLDLLVDRAVLMGNLLVDWVADLPGNWVAFFHWSIKWNLNWDCTALSDRLVSTDSLWNLVDDSIALCDRLRVTNCGRNIPCYCFTNRPWNSNTVGNIDTSWNINLTDSLNWNLAALSVYLLLALRSGLSNRNWRDISNSNWSCMDNSDWRGNGKSCRTSRKMGHRESIKTEELSISTGISICFSISFTFDNSLGKKLSSNRCNASRKSIKSSKSFKSVKSIKSVKPIKSKSSSQRTRRNQTSNRKAVDSSNRSCMDNNIGMSLNMNTGVSANLMDNILALLNKCGLRNICCLSCALLLLRTLLVSGSVALLLRHLGHNVYALLLSAGGTPLLRHSLGNCGTLLYRCGGTFFLAFSSEVGDCSGVAYGF